MGQFDNGKNIAILFAGAFLVSLCVIAFLNVEVQSRSNHDSKIKNENIFEIIGKKVSDLVSSLKEKNSHRRSLLYHLFLVENTTRSSMRKLQYFSEKMAEENFNETHHRLRHEKKTQKSRRTLEVEREEKNGSPFFTLLKSRKSLGNSSFFFDVPNNRTNGVKYKNSSEVISKQKLADHERCYTTNDVLEIIATTCLVNFIFWFMIISCVNIFTKNQMWKSQSFESLTSFSSVSEDELCQQRSKGPRVFINRRNMVECSLDSLNLHGKGHSATDGGRTRAETEVLVSTKSNEAGKRPTKTFSIINWKRNKLLRFSNNFSDRNFLTNGNKKNKYISQNKKQKIANSFSMENLIF